MDIKKLTEQLKQASTAYYNTGEVLMTDQEYDQKLEQLKQLDQHNPFLKTVGAPPIGTIQEHKIPMGSQSKLKDKTEFERWIKTISNTNLPYKYVTQHKLDGSSLAVNYENGKLVSAISRGDGLKGEILTQNVLRMQNIKKELPNAFTGSLRGEMMLSIPVFNETFKPLGHKNPRNTASGLSRNRKEEAEELQKHMKVIFYDIASKDYFETEYDKLEYINTKLGLEIVPTMYFKNTEDVWDYYKNLENSRNVLQYEIDGIIIRGNSLEIQEQLGMNSNMCPKGQACLKFVTNKAETTLREVIITIAHTGAMVPAGVLDPVEIGGATISNVLLNNYDYINELGLTKGCRIIIERAGDIIPHIKEVLNKTDVPILPPSECISCKGPLTKDGVYHKCLNEECDGVAIRKVKNWITKRNIKFIGDSLLDVLYEKHAIKEPYDLYKLTEEDLSKVNRGSGIVGTASKQIMAEIEKSKQCTIADLLGSVCIKFLGRRQVEIIIEVSKGKISALEDFYNLKAEDLLSLPGFKDSKANGIVDGIQKVKPTIEALLSAGVTIVEKEKPARVLDLDTPEAGGTNKLVGRAFCFTGAINKVDENSVRFTRKMMHDVVLKNGGQVLDEPRLVPNCESYLVQADITSQSSKSKKAVKIGATVISEEDFWKMVE